MVRAIVVRTTGANLGLVAKLTLKVSVSSLDTYESCPRKYKFQQIDKLPRKTWEHLDVGNYVHEVLEKLHKELNTDASQQPEALLKQIAKDTWAKFGAKISAAGQEKSKGLLKSYLSYVSAEGWPEVLATEDRFSIDITPNLVIRGVVDRIDRIEGGYQILDYKGLAIDTPIPTPSGWTTMGDLKVGDTVFGSDGNGTAVILKSETHNRPCYQLTLSDDSSVVCDNVHLWGITEIINGEVSQEICLDADELFGLLGAQDRSPRKIKSYFIKNPLPLQFPEAKLPANPWLIGAWLGNENGKTTVFAAGSEDLVGINKLLSSHCAESSPSQGLRWNTEIKSVLDRTAASEYRLIPMSYMMGSYDQRLALLQGLMDVSGQWSKRRMVSTFSTAKENFAHSVAELVRTFGVTAKVYNSSDEKGNPLYEIAFRTTAFVPFQLPRKADLARTAIDGGLCGDLTAYREITKMEEVASVPTQCIGVAAADHLYVGGKTMTCLHNTGQSKYLDKFQLQVYGMHLKNLFPEIQEYEGVYLVLPEGPKKLSYKITLSDIQEAKEDVIKTAEMISTDRTWDPKPTFLCKYCDYYDQCPDGWGKNRGPSSDLVKISGRKNF
jgi:RecB family exonuclease